MSKIHNVRYWLLLVGFVLCIIASPIGAAETNDIFQKVRAINPSLPAEQLSLSNWTVRESALGPQRQQELRPITAATIVKLDTTYYVEEKQTSRWLVGNLVGGQPQTIECGQSFTNLSALLDATAFAPLPKPPNGFALREIVRLPNHPSRLASNGQGKILYVLCVNGDVWRVDLTDNGIKQILHGDQYLDRKLGSPALTGMVLDSQNRLYLVANQHDDAVNPIRNNVTIFRTTAQHEGDPANPKPWLKTSYPFGIGPFNHGVGHIAFGPDGFLYVNSGSRSDGNETGDDDHYSKEGETPLTACIWRLDPHRKSQPMIEVYARGLRNAYGFAWNSHGEMFATDNGPNADPPEELNHIIAGKHYGFPYRFSNWTEKPYPYTPNPPAGFEFVPPVANLGPAGGYHNKPYFTFDPHSSPSGIVFLGEDFPPAYRNTFLVARFGNLLECNRDVGFDILQGELRKNKRGDYEAHFKTFLAPIARPVDLHLSGKGKVYICEYSRQIQNKGYNGMLPGRILELIAR
ncbi:MAG: Cytochrome c class [Pedosphaera sp.]|nr:Cytochrome c class [Pedosphaera sp.]